MLILRPPDFTEKFQKLINPADLNITSSIRDSNTLDELEIIFLQALNLTNKEDIEKNLPKLTKK